MVPHEEWWSKFDGHGISYCTKESGMKPGQGRRQRPAKRGVVSEKRRSTQKGGHIHIVQAMAKFSV